MGCVGWLGQTEEVSAQARLGLWCHGWAVPAKALPRQPPAHPGARSGGSPGVPHLGTHTAGLAAGSGRGMGDLKPPMRVSLLQDTWMHLGAASLQSYCDSRCSGRQNRPQDFDFLYATFYCSLL